MEIHRRMTFPQDIARLTVEHFQAVLKVRTRESATMVGTTEHKSDDPPVRISELSLLERLKDVEFLPPLAYAETEIPAGEMPGAAEMATLDVQHEHPNIRH